MLHIPQGGYSCRYTRTKRDETCADIALHCRRFSRAALRPTVDDSLGFAVPSGPQISPNGSQVVYQLSRTNWKENTFEGDLWIADIASPHARRKLDAGPGWSGEPRWSPDGKTSAFVSDRSGRRELFVIPAPGAKPEN